MWARLVIASLVTGPLLCSGSFEAPPRQDEFFLGGIQVNEPDHGRWVRTLRDVGMNTVAATVYARQGDWDSDQLEFATEEPAVLHEVRAARAAGLSTVLILRVALDHAYPRNKFLWHGMIMPDGDRALAGWFERYTRFAVQWARICQQEGVEVLGIGSEMKALSATLPITRVGDLRNYHGFAWYQRLERRRAQNFAEQIEERHLWVRGAENHDSLDAFLDDRFRRNLDWADQAYLRGGEGSFEQIQRRRGLINRHWIRLIEAVREVYDGRLTYAANFDNYRNVGFWPWLDIIGINGYFPLRAHVERDLDDDEKRRVFHDGWARILSEIDGFRHRQRLDYTPYLFTEIGYTFRRNSTVQPWAHAGFSIVGWKGRERKLVIWDEQPVDRRERALAVGAMHDVARRTDSPLVGLLYWKLSTLKEHEKIEPFVLHIGAQPADPLERQLARFVDPDPAEMVRHSGSIHGDSSRPRRCRTRRVGGSGSDAVGNHTEAETCRDPETDTKLVGYLSTTPETR